MGKRPFSQNQEYGQLGIIENVSLRNFMCHDNLRFDFEPHMNFIIGCNGSGKSAVLTGIILALGGKSGSTGRYSSVKGFIKTGKHSASVSVTLKNCGPEAYKPNEYGERITVERQFSADGASNYRLKSQAGQVLSTSKEELTNILTIMDIQIENPITVLTQDTSKTFLLSKNSKGQKLYQLFYKGTGLAKVEDDYNKIVQEKEETSEEIALKKSVLPDMEKEIKSLKTLLDSSSKLTELKNELLWAMAIEHEKKRDEAMAANEKIEKDETALNKKIDKCNAEYNKFGQQLIQVQTERKDCQDKMNQFRQKLVSENSKRSPLAVEVREISATLSRYEREANRLSNEINNLQNMINDIQIKNQSNVNEDKIRHETTVNELKSDISIIAKRSRDLDQKKSVLLENHGELQKKMDQCQTEIQELEYKMRHITKEKQQLIEGQNNKVNVFGREMVCVLQEIQRAVKAGLFKVEPKGPIGLYVNVKSPEWSFVIQECLKLGILKAFCCDNHSDADQLTKILNKYYSSARSRPSIITSKFVNQIHDVQRYKTVSIYPTVLDMLDINDPVITNCLIDQRQIENILLIADAAEAIDFMMYNAPKSCKCAYTLNGDQLYHSPFRNYAYRNKNQICILKTVNDEDIRRKSEELNRIQQALKHKNNKKVGLHKSIEETNEEIKTMDSDFIRFRTKLRELEMKVRDEENNYEEPRDINCLHGDLEQLLQERRSFIDQITAYQNNLSNENQKLMELDKIIENLKNTLQIESDKFQSLSNKSDEIESRKESLLIMKKKIESQINALKPSIESAKKELKHVVSLAQSFKFNAESCSPRIDTNRSADTIREIISETEKALKEQRNFDPETLATQYMEKVEKLNKAKIELDELESLNTQIGLMMTKRYDKLQKICKNNVVSLTCCFTALLKENGFTGYPDVNLKNKTLEIYAKPEKMDNISQERQNLSQLSGGERSYVTISFLLALWDRIHMPFRILDEYDVYMDANNRHLSINLLINAAKSNKNIQYIFLSPLELPQMENSKDIKIHKMQAPRR